MNTLTGTWIQPFKYYQRRKYIECLRSFKFQLIFAKLQLKKMSLQLFKGKHLQVSCQAPIMIF